jgi:branched-chain amino acid transport system permease protein
MKTSAIFRPAYFFLVAALLLPAMDYFLPAKLQFASLVPAIMVFAVIGLGLNIIAGFTGLLNLGSAAFMAIGAYTFAILTCPIYPFQIGFFPGLMAAALIGGAAGILLALPTMRLRGDYVAIVTLGFGEIIQDVLKNLDAVTKGTQGINPVAVPALPSVTFAVESPNSWHHLYIYAFDPNNYIPWYYLYFALLIGAVCLCHNLRYSRLGRSWVAVREDELAARAMGINTPRVKLIAFSLGSALCSIGGALYSSLSGTSLDPSIYDFQQSVIILCIVIVGGMGNVTGVLLGALIMVGFNSIVLTKLTDLMARNGLVGDNVLAAPGNWKFMIYGIALIFMMRLRPEGLLPAKDVQAELHHADDKTSAAGAR